MTVLTSQCGNAHTDDVGGSTTVRVPVRQTDVLMMGVGATVRATLRPEAIHLT